MFCGMKTSLCLIFAELLLGITALAQEASTLSAASPLPELYHTNIKTAEDWQKIRRPELLKTFTQEMYGVMPGLPQSITYTVFESSTNALKGLATRKQIALEMKNN